MGTEYIYVSLYLSKKLRQQNGINRKNNRKRKESKKTDDHEKNDQVKNKDVLYHRLPISAVQYSFLTGYVRY